MKFFRMPQVVFGQDMKGLLERFSQVLEPLLNVAKVTAYTNFGQGKLHRALIEFFFNVPVSSAEQNSRFNA